MNAPSVKRVNTIGIKYLEGHPDYNNIDLILDKTLHIHDDEIKGIVMSDDYVAFKISTYTKYQQICTDFEERILNINSFKFIIEDLSTYTTKVTICGAPLELTNATIEESLQPYGKVVKIYSNSIQHGRYKGILNGVRTAEVDIRKPIPSCIFLECI